MKHFFHITTTLLFVLILSQGAIAQCVGCSPGNSGFNCISQRNGATICNTTDDRRTCTVSGLCKKDAAPFEDYFYKTVKFKSSSILEIAKLHPLLAQTLIQLQGRTLAEMVIGEMHWMPGEVYYEDIQQMLEPTSDKKALIKTIQTRDRVALQKGYKPISYLFKVEKNSDNQTVTLQIERKDNFVSLHDSYSFLEIIIDTNELVDNGSWKLR